MPNGSTQNVEQAVRKVLGGVLSDVSDELRTSARGVNGARHAFRELLNHQTKPTMAETTRRRFRRRWELRSRLCCAICPRIRRGRWPPCSTRLPSRRKMASRKTSRTTTTQRRMPGRKRQAALPASNCEPTADAKAEGQIVAKDERCRGDQTTQESRSSRLPGCGEGCQPRKKGVQQVGRQPLELQPGEVGNQELAFDDAVGAGWTISRLTCLHGSGRSELQKRRSRFVIHESGERRGNGQQYFTLWLGGHSASAAG